MDAQNPFFLCFLFFLPVCTWRFFEGVFTVLHKTIPASPGAPAGTFGARQGPRQTCPSHHWNLLPSTRSRLLLTDSLGAQHKVADDSWCRIQSFLWNLSVRAVHFFHLTFKQGNPVVT